MGEVDSVALRHHEDRDAASEVTGQSVAKRPLRILVGADMPPDPNSGAAGTVYHTNQALRELGNEVDEIWADDLGRRRVRHGNLHSLVEQPRGLRRAVLSRLAAKDYDVIQLSQPQAYLAARAVRRRQLRAVVVNRSHGLELRVNAVMPGWHRKLGVPQARSFRSIFTPLLRRLLERHWAGVVRYCDGIIVPCRDDRDFLTARLPVNPQKVRVIHHGIPREFVTQQVRDFTPERAQRILYAGQYTFLKGPMLLADAVNQVLAATDKVTMTWVCAQSDHRQATDRIEETFRSRVRFRSWMPQEELKTVYDEHGIFLFPSFFEGAGKASLEAMSRGMCVVASATGGMRDYIEDGRNGLLVPPGDATALASTTLGLLSDLERSREISEEAARTACSYTWERCAKRAVVFYEQLAGIRRFT